MTDFRKLQRFVLLGVRPTGRQLGEGSYGRVEEVEVNGQVCAGKRLHEVLLEQGNSGVENMKRKYHEECQVRCYLFFYFLYEFVVYIRYIHTG